MNTEMTMAEAQALPADEEEQLAYEPLEIPSSGAELGVKPKDPKAGLPAEQRIATLFEEVGGLKPVFVGTVDFCRDQRRADEVNARFAELTEFNACTFSPVRVRALLEEAGALRYVEPETTEKTAVKAAAPDANAADAPTDQVYQITKRPEGWWIATSEGLAVLDAMNPVNDLTELFDEDPELAPAYCTVLEALLAEPRSVQALAQLTEANQTMRERHLYAPYLLKKLEERGAVEYRGAWTLLEPGEQILAAHVGTL